MSTEIERAMAVAADAAAGAMSSLPMRKRKKADGEDEVEEPDLKAPKTTPLPGKDAPPQSGAALEKEAEDDKSPVAQKAREVRLEQNRKAARESRRRKKVMIEELQRSVIFFSRANGTLKQQNDELTRLLLQAQNHVAGMGDKDSEKPGQAVKEEATAKAAEKQDQQTQAQTVATQAMFESQGFPAAAARAAAQTLNASNATGQSLPPMQPGATMQAMANFQQAAAAAMQNAMQGMQGIPGLNMSQLSAAPAGANAQQAYTDTMTALAMQQAAAAASGQQFVMQPGVQFVPVMWQQQANQVQQSDEKQS